MDRLRIFAGNSHIRLAKRIAENLEPGELNKVKIGRFADGEISITDLENVRGCDTFIIQPTQPPGDNLLELLFLADTMKRASALSITAVIPYFGYARQDRKTASRDPITASTIARLLEASKVDRILTMNLHTDQLEASFNVPVDHLRSRQLMIRILKKKVTPNTVLVSPDIGFIKTVRRYARLLGDVEYAWIDKRRQKANQSEVMSINGASVEGKDLIFIDDMIDTGGTMTKAVKKAKSLGAESIIIVATHGVFGNGAGNNLKAAPIDEIIITNTLPRYGNIGLRKIMKAKGGKLTIVDVAPMFARAIRKIQNNESLRPLFT